MEEDITVEEKNDFIRRINLAMINMLEFGQRANHHITASLRDRKLPPDIKNSDLFNSIIDNLIMEIQAANIKLNKEIKNK